MRVVELPWQADPTRRFRRFADRPWAVLLDSCHDQSGQGRFDIFAAEPYATFESTGRRAVLTRGGERQVLYGNPFRLLSELLGPQAEGDKSIPFCGGAIGYLSYELGRACVGLTACRTDMPDYPELAMGFYDWSVVSDHQEQRCYLATHERSPATRLVWEDLHARLLDEPPVQEHSYRLLAPLCSDFTQEAYATAFQAVQNYIEAGDCYQVNLAQRFSAPSEGRLWTAYQTSRTINPAPFSAYFNHPELEIASASPERFLEVTDGRVETCPIKGTARRIPGQEGQQRDELKKSAKDRAENLMIVDLLRNDLSKNCAAGTVKVPELFKVESFATVHHLISTVTGELREGRTALDLLEGCFPRGLDHRGSEAPSDGNHRGTGAEAERRVLWQPRVCRVRREHGQQHRDSHDGAGRGRDQPVRGRWTDTWLANGSGISGVSGQGHGHAGGFGEIQGVSEVRGGATKGKICV